MTFAALSRRVAKGSILPILCTVPRSGTWFLRYSVSFFFHLRRGGRITDRLTGQSYGDPAGPPFDFASFMGGPLFAAGPDFASNQLFIGHTVCPGFSRIADKVPWWHDTPFHVRGYDYLHGGLDYDFTPIDLGRRRFASISPERLEDLVWEDARQRMVLVYREPVAQAESFFQFSKGHAVPDHRRWGDRPLEELSFREYLLEAALPSYAKQFASYSYMAACLPDQVKLVPYETLTARPGRTLASILGFLAGRSGFNSIEIGLAVHLARQQHLQAVERELKRPLGGDQGSSGSHIQSRVGERPPRDAALYADVARRLVERGMALHHFVWPQAAFPERIASEARGA